MLPRAVAEYEGGAKDRATMRIVTRFARVRCESARRALAVLGIATLAAAGPATAQPAPTQGLDEEITQAMKAWRVPGLAIAIVKDDSVVFVRGFGVRELGRPAPVDERTVFAIGSTSKAFTAALMGMLVDSGRVSWGDRVADVLPGFALYDPWVTRELTVRDLLTHRSGLARGDLLWYASKLSRDEVIHQIRHLEPSWGFRTHFGYQNIMFLTAGQIEARIAGLSWDELVRQRLFLPLGMTSTVTSTDSLRRLDDVAAPHAEIDDSVMPIPWRNIDNIGPAGSINSNVLDMAKWVRLQLGHGVFAGRRLLSDSVVAEMHAPQMLIPITPRAEGLNPDTHFSAYGLGWFLLDYRGRKVIHHGGNIDGFSAEVDLMPEENLGLVILTNMNGTQLRDALPFSIFDRFIGGSRKNWSEAYLEVRDERRAAADSTRAKVDSARVMGTHPSLPLEAYAGVYHDPMYGDVQLAVEDGHLVLHDGPAYVGDLEHWHFDTFRVTWRDRLLGTQLATFELDESGRPATLELEEWADFARVQTPDGAAVRR